MKAEIGGPIDGETERRIRDSFGRQGLMAHLGATLHEVRHGLVSIRMPFRAELSQQHGYFHAGGTSAIADSAGGYAAYTTFPAASSVLTVELKINLLNPAYGEALEARGTVIKAGRTLTVCQIEVFAERDDERVLVALAQQTLICLEGRRDTPAGPR
ncbi:DUF4442 domain-containing protein [Acuticoccus sediminis]|uniref:Medium/long-chain acyl-CoA thioesterase YigI n=1 Tax=Acuticoccus sediminis TaxID=2184697 RepID=A0A8B2NJJ6_9HYPH|nr:PaaI family thioesterase [Acuticoccus sediminis]RAH96097.1 DUF4442 domain-containing protein [Acuticoccus sediminis]